MDQSQPGTEDATSVALDDATSSFMSPEDNNMEYQDLTSDKESDNFNENVCLPALSCTAGRRTTLFKFRAEAVVNDLAEHKDIAAKYRLTYKQGKSNCRLIDKLLSGHGFREADQEAEDYNLCWMGSHVRPEILASMQSFQRVNHFPSSHEITHKDKLCENVEKMQQAKGFKNFDFMPQTFVLPIDYNKFLAESSKERCTWMIKPADCSEGRGIFLTNNPHQCLSRYQLVVCKYITNPLLINGLKFDISLYVAVTSFNPLVIYLYEEGLTQFATIPYSKSSETISNICMHLTNYSANKCSSSFIRNTNSEVENEGSTWTLGALLRYLKKEGHDTTSLMLSIEDVIIKTLIAGEYPISASCENFVKFKANCFELFGFDILLDDNFKPWVLEVNHSPSLDCDAPLDLKVKSNMVSDLLNLVGLECRDPVTKNFEDDKMDTTNVGNHDATSDRHLQDSKTADSKLIWQLTDEEQRMVSRFKDEFERKGNWVRIFPTETSWDTYRQLFLTLRRNAIILHKELCAENKKNRINMAKSGHKFYLDKEAYLFHLAEQRCKQYERSLPVLSPSSSTISLKKVSPRILPEGSQASGVCPQSDQSHNEECEIANGSADESKMLWEHKNLSVNRSPQWEAILTERLPQHATPSQPGSEDSTSAALDDINSSFMSSEDNNVKVRDITSDEADNINENVCLPALSCTAGLKTTLFKFRAEAVVNDLPEHKDIAAKYRLTYKQGKSNCRLIDKLLSGHGFRKADQEANDYNLCWMDSHVMPQFFASMQSFQRVNHFPSSIEITKARKLYQNVEKLSQKVRKKMQMSEGFRNFNFVPQTFTLPAQYDEFLTQSYKKRCTWIMKPADHSGGRGIFLTNDPHQCLSRYKTVACEYITRPLLINGLKFDISLYVAVTSFNPLVIYLYEEGLTQFATVPYDKNSKAFNTCMHLTNCSANKCSSSFVRNTNSEVENEGSTWTLGALLRYLKKEGHDTTSLMLSIEDVIIKTLIAGEYPISASCENFVKFKANCFELFGFEILLDENFRSWVLEVNHSPSLDCDAPLDLKVKSNMVSDLLNLVGVECRDPVTKNFEDDKMDTTNVGNHDATSNRHLQESKTPDGKLKWHLTEEEQRMVSRFKDEFERKGNWVRIFPTETSLDIYDKLVSFPRNNILLHLEFFAKICKKRKNMEKSGHKDCLDNSNYEAYRYHLAEQRCKQYERSLSVLSPSSSTISLKKEC